MNTTCRSFLCVLWVILHVVFPVKADSDILSRKIQLPESKGTVYKLLGQVSGRSGFLFIYDSHVVDNDRESGIKGGEYTVREAVAEITGDKELRLRVIGSHILIYKPETEEILPPELAIAVASPPDKYLTVEGKILDKYSDRPIAFATVGIPEMAIGTVTNQNGEFRFRFPDSLRYSTLRFSHIGYLSYEIEAGLLAGTHQRLALEPKIISLQEVIVRVVNPEKALDDFLENLSMNYANKPVYQTVFYREGTGRKKEIINLTEAVFQIYKTPFNHSYQSDLVRLLKMRHIVNPHEKDTVITKFKSGINACLMLDLVKNLPDFLRKEDRILYDYAHTDIRVVDNRLVNVISFEQKKGIRAPLYKGELYIDTENSALSGGTFQVHPGFVKESASMFVEKKSKNLTIIPEQVRYTISYKENNGIYYVNHVRGDLQFRIRKKRKLFSTTAYAWFEMVICKTETENVQPFERAQRLPTRTVFADTHFEYDKGFWENFNIILPEESLHDAISEISSVIEETEF